MSASGRRARPFSSKRPHRCDVWARPLRRISSDSARDLQLKRFAISLIGESIVALRHNMALHEEVEDTYNAVMSALTDLRPMALRDLEL